MSGARPWLRSLSIRAFIAGVAERDHAALAGGDLLVGVEAEHGRVAAAADRRAVGVAGAQRLAGVLDDRQVVAARDRLEGAHLGRVAEDVHGQDRLRALGDRRLGRLGVEVERHRVDVREHRARALVQRRVRGGHERERAGDHLVAPFHPHRAQREVQAGRAAGDGAGKMGSRPPRRRAARTPARTRPPSGPARARPSAAPRAPPAPPRRPAWAVPAGSSLPPPRTGSALRRLPSMGIGT